MQYITIYPWTHQGGRLGISMHIHKTLARNILIIDYALAVLTVAILWLAHITDSLSNNLYGVLFLGFIPVFGGLYGLSIARRWGFLKSALGRATVFFSLGLISWGIGTYIFSGVYNFILNVPVPYPSIADVGYILSLPLWVAGMIQLSRATGARYSLRSSKGKALLLLIPTLIIGLSYYLLVTVARGGSLDLSLSDGALKFFFDLAYPVGDVVILSIATVIYGLSYNYFGGVYKKAIYLILSGFALMYIADFSFSYTTTLDTFYPAGWVDLLFTTAVFVLSLGIMMLDPRVLSKKQKV